MFHQQDEHFFLLEFFGGWIFSGFFFQDFLGVLLLVLLVLGEAVFSFGGCFVWTFLKIYKDTETLTKISLMLSMFFH